jgi:hypothetical protein
MKRFLLFTLLVSFIGYSQNPIQNNHPSFKDGLPQDLEFQNSQNITENNDYTLHLNHFKGNWILLRNGKLDTDFIGSSEQKFDEYGNIILGTRENWNFESNISIPMDKYEHTYNENGNRIQTLEFYWDIESQSYSLSNKKEHTNNENGNLIQTLEFYWDIESQSYSLSNKKEHTHNENGNLIQTKKSFWNTESQSFSYTNGQKEEYTYNVNGDRILLLVFNWNMETESFDLPKSRTDFVYDENQRLISRTVQRTWDSNNQLWDFRTTRDYVWDENDNNTLVTQKFWDLESNSYIPSHKTIKTFSNFSQNFIFESSTIHSWNEEINIYEPTFKTIVSTTLDSEDKLHRTGTISKYNIESDNWDEIDSRFFKYTKTPSLSTNSVEPNSFSIYPNPTKGNLNINSSESLTNPIIELYDVKGSKILSNPFRLTEPIDVSDLQPSMYIYNVKDGSEVKQSGKIIKE